METIRKEKNIRNNMQISVADGSKQLDFGQMGMKPKVALVGKISTLNLVKLTAEDVVDLEQSQKEMIQATKMRAFIKTNTFYPVIPSYGDIVMFPITDVHNQMCKEVTISFDALTFNRALYAEDRLTLFRQVGRRGDDFVNLNTKVEILPPNGAPRVVDYTTKIAVTQNAELHAGNRVPGRLAVGQFLKSKPTYNLPPFSDEYVDAGNWGLNKIHKTLATAMASVRQITNDNLYTKFRTIQQIALNGGSQRSFWLKMWLDFFQAGLVELYGNANVVYGAAAAAPQLINWNSNNEPNNEWRQFIQNQMFMCEIDRGNYNGRTRNLYARYASAWPRQTVTLANNFNNRARALRTSTIVVPGHNTLLCHYGEEEVLPGALANIVQPSQNEILGFMVSHLSRTHTHSDCMFGFQYAAQWVFGKASDSLGNNTVRGSLVSLATPATHWRSFDQLESLTDIAIHLDDTRCEYLRPFTRIPEDRSGTIDLLESHPHELEQMAVRYSLSLGMAFDTACYASGFTRQALASYQFNAANTEANHIARMINTTRNERLNRISSAILNASAWMFGFAPMVSVVETKMWASDLQQYTTLGQGAYRLENEMAVSIIPMSVVEFTRAIPDAFMLPFEDGIVKWPNDLSLPVKNTKGAIADVRLGNTLPFGRELSWQVDGGQQYNAQYYHSMTVDEFGQGTMDVLQWVSPNQSALPVNPVAVPYASLPAPFNNFMRPGFMNTTNFNTYENFAYAARSTAGNSVIMAEIATKSANKVTRVRPMSLSTFVPESSRRYAYDTAAYISVPRARYENIAVLSQNAPSVGVPNYYTEPIGRVYTQPSRHLSGPSYEANDTRPNEGTQGPASMQFKSFNTTSRMSQGRKAKNIKARNPQMDRERTPEEGQVFGPRRDDKIINGQTGSEKAMLNKKNKIEAEKHRNDNFVPLSQSNPEWHAKKMKAKQNEEKSKIKKEKDDGNWDEETEIEKVLEKQPVGSQRQQQIWKEKDRGRSEDTKRSNEKSLPQDSKSKKTSEKILNLDQDVVNSLIADSKGSDQNIQDLTEGILAVTNGVPILKADDDLN